MWYISFLYLVWTFEGQDGVLKNGQGDSDSLDMVLVVCFVASCLQSFKMVCAWI